MLLFVAVLYLVAASSVQTCFLGKRNHVYAYCLHILFFVIFIISHVIS